MTPGTPYIIEILRRRATAKEVEILRLSAATEGN
jgi:hypothetical protein